MKLDTRFFFPVGDHSKFDKNPSWKNDEYRNLIQKISGRYQIGLHPSFYAARRRFTCQDLRLARLKSLLRKRG